ncbi:MAG: primosomal protein N' [Bacteroidetes bacterium]|nr:primosomal protein N' [Bacteroidota bacterium]
MESNELYVDVILPISIPNLFTYKVPIDLSNRIKVGVRVIIPFHRNKIITGIIDKIHSNKPEYITKDVYDVIDNNPTLNNIQLTFLKWISDYYMCHLGEVLNAALPAGLKISFETKIEFNKNKTLENVDLTLNEKNFINLIKEKGIIEYKNIETKDRKVVKYLVEKGILLLSEKIKNQYKPKIIKKISLNKTYFDDEKLQKLFLDLEKNKKQLNVLIEYFKYISMKPADLNDIFIDKRLLQKNVSSSSLTTLIKKQIFNETEQIVSRFKNIKKESSKIELSEKQNIALNKIYQSFDKNKVSLLHGITGSGKTEIYITLIKEAINAGGEVLFLMPEIALTTQMVKRIKKIFGDEMNVFHSRYSDNERVEVWNNIKNKKVNFVIGTRSSIFLPFSNLSLIIIDEEHDYSYKQKEPNPRYNSRDCAIILGQFHNAKILLGSATPSIESYFNVKTKKYSLIELKERFSKIQLPEIKIINTKNKNKSKNEINLISKDNKPIEKLFLNSNTKDQSSNLLLKENLDIKKSHDLEKKLNSKEISYELIEAIDLQLKQKNQVLIFQNLRGYSPYIMCEDCEWIPNCNNCDVTLTYHQQHNILLCHYCNSKIQVYKYCLKCNSHKVKNVGYGTERIEEKLSYFFNKSRIERMDLDTTRGKYKYENIISKIENNETDIIVGTQMISKGFDFNKIGLVGIVDIDRIIKMPDFRAKEKAFQLGIQVSGRAGRRKDRGLVIIQTYDPKQKILEYIKNNDYQNMFLSELNERKLFLYPPYKRLIKIILKHRDLYILRKGTFELFKKLSRINRNDQKKMIVLGPQTPIISRIKNYFILNIWIKLDNDSNLNYYKDILKNKISAFLTQKDYKQIKVLFDVDPY